MSNETPSSAVHHAPVPDAPAPDAPARIRVYLLDDHEIVRRGIRELLEADGDIVVVGESASAVEAARRIPALRPDVAVLDGRLPDGSGDRRVPRGPLGRPVASRASSSRRTTTTTRCSPRSWPVRRATCSSRCAAPTSSQEYDGWRPGQSLLDPALTAQVLERIRSGPQEDEDLQVLTPQEKRILQLVGEGLTNREVARRMFLSEKTVKNYVSSMLAKLGLTSRTQAAVFAARHPAG